MAHVTNFLGLLEQLQSADITVHQGRCAIVRNRNATCMKCADVCTSGCISYDDNELVIEPERCIGCGTCATVCPTCALEAHRPNDAELLQACRAAADVADGQVVIACDQLLAAADGLYDPRRWWASRAAFATTLPPSARRPMRRPCAPSWASATRRRGAWGSSNAAWWSRSSRRTRRASRLVRAWVATRGARCPRSCG